MTRAKDHLHLIVAAALLRAAAGRHGDRHVYAPRSRFIPDALTELFDSCASPVVTQAEDHPEVRSDSSPTVDIAARVRARWSTA